MTTRPRTLPEIRAEGFRALVERLGVADALRFIQQYESGQGDYTAERHEWLDSLTVDELRAEVDRLREEKSRKRE